MNEKITLPGLTQLLALQSGDTRKQSEDFIKEFFSLISSTLAEGDQIKIKDLGVFKTITVEARKSVDVSTGEENEIPSHRKVVFVPSKELAAVVNEPFEMFETVEVEENFDLDESDESQTDEQSGIEEYSREELENPTENVTTDSTIDQPELSDEDISEVGSISYAEDHGQSDSIEDVPIGDDSEPNEIDSESSGVPESLPGEPVVVESESICDEVDQTIESSDPEESEGYEEADNERPRNKFWPGFIIGFLSAALIGGAIWVCCTYLLGCNKSTGKIISTTIPAETIEDTLAPEDDAISTSVNENQESDMTDSESEVEIEEPTAEVKSDIVPTTPSDQKVYDTIGKTRYLTTMAKDHYGNYNLWPIIYEENKAFLGHPDRIRPGTKVVIPSLSKYGIDPSNPDDIASVKRKGVEIYSRYK